MTLELNKNDVVNIITALSAIKDISKEDELEALYNTIDKLCVKIVKQYVKYIESHNTVSFEWSEE